MNCNLAQDLLLLYHAGELPSQDAAQVRSHLAECAACSLHAAQLSETEEQLRTELRAELSVPETLDQRVLASVRRFPRPRPAWWQMGAGWPTMPRGPLALAAATAAILVFMAGRWSSGGSLAGPETVDLLALSRAHQQLEGAPAPEVRAASPEQLSTALTRQARFTVQPVNLTPEATHLVGGTSLQIQGVPVACLHYRWRGERVSLFQMDAQRLSPDGLRQLPQPRENYVAVRKDGISCVAWRSGNLNCVLVAKAVPMHHLFQIACHACERQTREREAVPL